MIDFSCVPGIKLTLLWGFDFLRKKRNDDSSSAIAPWKATKARMAERKNFMVVIVDALSVSCLLEEVNFMNSSRMFIDRFDSIVCRIRPITFVAPRSKCGRTT